MNVFIYVTVEFPGGKFLQKSFPTRQDAEIFLWRLKGEPLMGWIEDGSFAIYRGGSVDE